MSTYLKTLLLIAFTAFVVAPFAPSQYSPVASAGLEDAIGIPGANTSFSDLPQGRVTSILQNIATWLLGLVGLLAFLALIWGGISYIISIGDESQAAKAKKIILYAIIGLVVVGISATLIATVKNLVGIT